jgi:hypothetical protein
MSSNRCPQETQGSTSVPASISLHTVRLPLISILFTFSDNGHCFSKDFGSTSIGEHNNLIVHLFPLALRGDNARTSQICEMMRNHRQALVEISVEGGAMVVDVNKNGLTIEVDNHADYIRR